MFYPNGNYRLAQLIKDFESGDFDMWLEKVEDPPEGYDWKKQGFYRGPATHIDTIEDLKDAVLKDMGNEYTICIETKPSYYDKHPYEGESKSYIKEEFFWEYSSPFGLKRCYKICPCSYLGERPKYVPLEIVCFEKGFNGSCFQIGSWERDNEGYEFRSCGSRMFDYVDTEDLPEIWKAIKAADEYLNNRYKGEKD